MLKIRNSKTDILASFQASLSSL